VKVLVFGNSGSGKSTLARRLAGEHGLAHLDLDAIVWEPGQVAVQRPAAAVAASLEAFVAGNARWVIEGCYGDLVQAASAHCTEMIFLNPGVAACLANNRRRPWEPHKYDSRAAQDAMLENLQAWVADYYTREDPWSYGAHRRVFDDFAGSKRERRLREAQPSDVADMQRIRRAVRENRLSDPGRITDADCVAAMEALGKTWLAVDGDEVVAFASAYRAGSVWALFVDPDHEGRGWGQALHAQAVDWLWSLGHDRIWLTTGAGTRAERFYLARGWQPRGLDPGGDLRLELGRP
jgi:adenylate kinase family enzyme